MTSIARSRRVGLAFALAGLAVVAFALVQRPSPAAAHPLGNFTINRYSRIELSAQGVSLRYVLDMAEIPAFQEQSAVDAGGDGEISELERSSYLTSKANNLRENLHLAINGSGVDLRVVTSDLSFPPGQGGLDTQRVVVDFAATLPEGWERSAQRVEYQDENYQERIGWREVVVRSFDGLRVFDSTAPSQDVSDELRAYPQDALANPLDVTGASFSFEPGGAGSGQLSANPPPESGSHAAAVRGNSDSPLASYAELIAKDRLSLGVIILALAAAVGFGALHALSPGHGKTVVAAYLVGSRGTARHALLLGLTVTATHTSSVYALGFVTLYLSDYILPEQLYPWLGLASGGLILAMGLLLFAQRLRAARLLPVVWRWLSARTRRLSGANVRALAAGEAGALAMPPRSSHGPAQHDGPHGRTEHADDDVPTHRHGFGPAHSHAVPGERLSLRGLIGLGIFGGLLPCPSAIVVMLSAVALHRVAFGLLLIVAFSVGLAGVLMGIGLFFVYAGRLSERVPVVRALSARLQNTGGLTSFAARAFPVGSAAAVAAAGLVITLRALAQQGVL